MSTEYALRGAPARLDASLQTSIAKPATPPAAMTVEQSTLVIFGITGDLARRKLLPAIYDLACRKLLPDGFAVVGFARHATQGVLETLRGAITDSARQDFNEDVWSWLTDRLHLIEGSFDNLDDFHRLKSALDKIAIRTGTDNCSFYMSIAPTYFELVCRQLYRVGLTRTAAGWRRLVVEKPFGRNLVTATALEQTIAATFDNDSVYRVDHYLGKETVQNILALRFANGLFEPLWNNRHIDHIQITMAEDIGVAGRAGYYDGVGAARDVIQNHLLQLLALIAMEEPLELTPSAIASEKAKVLGAASATAPFAQTTVRGQYTRGVDLDGHLIPALVDEDGFDSRSTTETYAAITVGIANRRWAGVPFYLKAGKRLPTRSTEIAVTFSVPAHRLSGFTPADQAGNVLVFRVQPNDGITLQINAKRPGDGMALGPVELELAYPPTYDAANRDAYERLILDVLRGDATLFPTRREVELSWAVIDPVTEFWSTGGSPEPYPAGSPGPESAEAMLAHSGRYWRSMI
ncbi:glucose-6-phosphate dehydrogenase [Rhodococcus sp. BP-252]|uniref:glucose-6-phosphate dehydrogenase n=1 Tax=unclassified Rhodococcus (in: high G+C Gram-positive bacteria) TaxID=192944 RepID=UPI001C9B5154|nr:MULTISPECIES: glucose-6-phosphate dehydrogenase [unclassified Rhodococcus (in: high G+C Gram-positive bacteria)]MBY6414674.1 glucose-6-phosphate dehydrogenase [Rhodococcus sp. BP-320]MBY6419499.1 glucose-6-phosphate dehydrogenase [Rhodococcus sp. BP-321]MBY6424489.1 glucose-6-phosphate dehydrogenase [Rhodococcus sp. BP-324]MBY6429510.1 glucose-6-phosphate dehydrogenase [Rhodococcus sp. BP-323]MBY6434499.1 glucose-6-phosphate dehydrogenase [Rhodococcus sp. BP-322]